MNNASDHTRPLIGVSPAYFISRFGDRFTTHQVAEALADIAAMGCRGFELEIYHKENIGFWLAQGAREVREQSMDSGLSATQFVAHFMLTAFSDSEHLFSNSAFDHMNYVLDIVQLFDECRTITIPMGPFKCPEKTTPDTYQRLIDRCIAKLERLLHMVESSDRRLALEVMPGSLVGGSDGFLRICDQLASPSLGFNLDTGHAWAAKENVYLIPAKLGHRILGTHLCDNFSHKNESFRPGAGSIDWIKMITALAASGYSGAFDLEIICTSRDVHREYRQGFYFINSILEQETRAAQ